MKKFFICLTNLIMGLFLCSLGVAITLRANIGYAPWDVFHVGLANTLGLSIGTIVLSVGIVVFIIVIILGEKFGLASILNVLLTGVFLDIILMNNIIPIAKNFVIGVSMLIFGLFVISIGSYFYIKPGFGAGPRDSLMVAVTRKTKFPVGVCRFSIEFIVTLVGWLLGGMVGAGTVIFVALVGLFIQVTFRLLKFDVTAVKHESLKETFDSLFIKKTAM